MAILVGSSTSTALLGQARMPRRVSTRVIAGVVATIAAVAAVATVTVMVEQRETVLLAKRRASITAAMLNPAQGVQLASKTAPVVYYYLPEDKAAAHSSPLKKAAAEKPSHFLQLAEANSTALVCTEDNIKALAGTVQEAWSACKAAADDYDDSKEWLTPNKDAKRRLLSWVWEPESANEKKTDQPKYAPDHYKVKLSEANRHAKLAQHAKQAKLATPVKQRVQLASSLEQQTEHEATMLADAKNKTKGPFKDCLIEATKDPCQKISGCKDPVCNSYYDDPEIEALCGMCDMAPLAGCFAHSSEVYVKGKGAVKISELEIGDSVLAASPQGTPSSSEVIFMHDHKETSATVQIFVADDMMELTPAHMVAVHTETCGLRYCSDAQLVPAKQIRAGDKIYVSDGITTAVQTVTAVNKGASKVRYVITSDDTIVVNGVVAPVYSTSARGLETLPFHLLHTVAKGALQWAPIKAALEVILESPALQSFEAIVNAFPHIKTVKVSAGASRALVAPQLSY